MQDHKKEASPLARTSKDFKPQLTKWPNQYSSSDQTDYRWNENRNKKRTSAFQATSPKRMQARSLPCLDLSSSTIGNSQHLWSPSLGPTYCLLCIYHVGYFIKFHIHIADDIDRRFFVCYGASVFHNGKATCIDVLLVEIYFCIWSIGSKLSQRKKITQPKINTCICDNVGHGYLFVFIPY